MDEQQPFSGYRVIDFTRVVSGPYATLQLAFLGADVIKVESAEGDDARRMAPDPAMTKDDMSPAFMALAMNKRSVVLDLKSEDGRAAAEALILSADAVVENFRPGVMDRLGLGYEALAVKKPDLIFCSISGFGQSGPRVKSPAYDARLQAMSGIMSITGQPETGPVRAGYAVVDAAAGMAAAFAIASAFLQRERTGKGQRIDVPMLDATLSHMSPTVAEETVGGRTPRLAGNQGTSGRPTANLFPCRDGHVMLAVNTEGQFQGLAQVIGKPDLGKDPRFQDWDARKANEVDLRQIIEAGFAERDGADLEAALDAASVPASRVRDIADILGDAQVAHRGLMQKFDGYSLVGPPFSFAWGGPKATSAPPTIGQHTEEVLAEITPASSRSA